MLLSFGHNAFIVVTLGLQDLATLCFSETWMLSCACWFIMNLRWRYQRMEERPHCHLWMNSISRWCTWVHTHMETDFLLGSSVSVHCHNSFTHSDAKYTNIWIKLEWKPGRGTHIFGRTGMCRSNGSLFYKKSLNMGPVFYQKILKHGSTFLTEPKLKSRNFGKMGLFFKKNP